MAALRRGLRQMVCVLPLLVLAACNGVGKGDKIDHLQMVNKSGTTIVVLTESEQVLGYQCLRQQLGIFAVFGKNGSADYSLRPATTWTSSNPDVVRVSNGDEPDPTQPGRVFAKGVITPLRAGSAIITADYVGITTSVQVIVRVPDSIILSTSQFDFSSNASTSGPFNMATGSTQQYYAYARLRDENDIVVVRDVTGQAKWSTPDDPTNNYIAVTTPPVGLTTGGGLVAALAPSGPVTVQANFSACPGTQYEYINADVQVSGLNSLSVQHDPAFNPANPLVIGTREAFKVVATLNNGATQDLSLQSNLKTNGSDGVMAFAGNVGVALGLGTTNITASFKESPPSPPLAVSTQNAVLSGFAIAASDYNQQIPTQGFYDHYHAVGTFTPVLPGPVFTQDLTHDTVWATSVPTDVTIGNAADTAGLAVSQKSAKTCVKIAGVLSSDTNRSDSTKLGVGVGVSPSTCPTN